MPQRCKFTYISGSFNLGSYHHRGASSFYSIFFPNTVAVLAQFMAIVSEKPEYVAGKLLEVGRAGWQQAAQDYLQVWGNIVSTDRDQ